MSLKYINILAALALGLTIVHFSDGSDSISLIPELAHTSAHVYKGTSRPGVVEAYHVEEFIDFPRNRSTSVVYGETVQSMKIYYNMLMVKNGRYQKMERSFTSYDVFKDTCASLTSSMSTWPLNNLRRIAIHLLPSTKATAQVVDVALGPSILIKTIEANLDKFEYKTTSFSNSRLTFVDVYSRPVDEDPSFPSIEFGRTILKITLYKRGRESSKVSQTLAATIAKSGKFELCSITLCKLGPGQTDESSLHEGGYVCGETGEMMVHVDFWFIKELVSDSLIGKSIQEPVGVRETPFSLPRGIGCLETKSYTEWRQFSAPVLQFSATYSTSNSSDGLSYVAYDGHNSVFRLDRASRKGVYDLISGISYHTTDFGLSSKFVESPSKLAKNCIALKITDKKLDQNIAPIERLLGVGHNGASPAFYLGTRVIDHVSYEVYERELVFGELIEGAYNLPIIMEPANYEMPTFQNQKFLITYYVREIKLAADTTGKITAINEPKYIELMRFDPTTKHRLLINRLEFSAFSWKLDVEPSDESDLSRIFSMDACSKQRHLQTQLRFRLSVHTDRNNGLVTPKTPIRYLRENSDVLRMRLVEELTSLLEIPRLSLNRLDIAVRDSGDLFVEAKIVDPVSGIEEQEFLGTVSSWEAATMDKVRLSMLHNRHSLDECKVDSMQDSRENWFVFCKELASCILLRRDPELKKKFSLGEKSNSCVVYRYDWKPKPIHRDESMLTRTSDNVHRINQLHMEVDLTFYDEQSNRLESLKFEASGHSAKVRSSDRAGSALSNYGESPLTGFRFTTMKEEPSTMNMNANFYLTNFMDPMKHCLAACQLDDYCGSFSVCRRKGLTPQDTDCVLSTMSFTAENLAKLSAQFSSNPKADSIQFEISTKYHSQIVKLRQDDRCSLHPKDLIEAYKPLTVMRYIEKHEVETPVAQAKPIQFSDLVSREETTSPLASMKSLDECARESHETSMGSEKLTSVSFAYCPFESLCYSDASKVFKSPKLKFTDKCYVYEKHHTQYYTNVPVTRAVIRKDKLEEIQAGSEKLEYTKVVKGLSVENCARICSSASSTCLAFDWCKFKSGSVCVLSSVRSPIEKVNSLAPLLPIEKNIYTPEGRLVTSQVYSLMPTSFCDHFRLKEDYFEVRVRQLLERERYLAERDESIKKEEKNELDEDMKRGEQNLDELKRASGDQNDQTETKAGEGGGGELGVNVLLVLVGLACGCLGVLYGPQVFGLAMDLYRGRGTQLHANEDLGRLALANNLEL